MTVNPAKDRKRQHDGKTYYFCSDGCIRKFEADPVGILEVRERSTMNVGAVVKGDPSCCCSASVYWPGRDFSDRVAARGVSFQRRCIESLAIRSESLVLWLAPLTHSPAPFGNLACGSSLPVN